MYVRAIHGLVTPFEAKDMASGQYAYHQCYAPGLRTQVDLVFIICQKLSPRVVEPKSANVDVNLREQQNVLRSTRTIYEMMGKKEELGNGDDHQKIRCCRRSDEILES